MFITSPFAQSPEFATTTLRNQPQGFHDLCPNIFVDYTAYLRRATQKNEFFSKRNFFTLKKKEHANIGPYNALKGPNKVKIYIYEYFIRVLLDAE